MKTVLVTGATGVIGRALVEAFLAEPDVALRLIIRASSNAQLDQRLQELFDYWGFDRSDARAGRVRACAGDVAQTNLGLDEDTCRRLVSEVTHIVHSAGNVKLNRPLEEARRTAVESTMHIVAFARACAEHGQFEKLEFVSTVGVAGRTAGVVPEDRLSGPRSFRNTYEAAKAEAEDRLVEAMSTGLRATVHRPSMVVGDSKDGRVSQFQVFYHLCEFLSGRRTRGLVADAGDVRLDIVPVDYVAHALRISTNHPETAGRVFHLCAGPDDAPRINDLIEHVRTFFVAHGRPAPPLRRVSPAFMRTAASVAAPFMPGSAKALRSLPYFLAYLEAPQTFANVESRRFFEACGLALPGVGTYLDRVLGYYLSQVSQGTHERRDAHAAV